jgi:hypothetical protein
MKVYFKEIGYKDVDWIHLDQDRDQWQTVEKTAMKLPVPSTTGHFLTS